ncbi:hypothetical protein ACP275_07G053500 [Erythranthe tilingii]
MGEKWADDKRRPCEFDVGAQVMVKLFPQQFKALRSVRKGLVRRYEGPFPVIAKVGKVYYRLELLICLKPYHEDNEDPSRGESHRAPPSMTKSYDKEIEEVLGRQVKRRRGVPPSIQYLIKWKGLPELEATWETKEDLCQFQDRLHLFEATRTSPD